MTPATQRFGEAVFNRALTHSGDNPKPDGPALAAAGPVAPHWQPPWGLDADADTQLMIDEKPASAGAEWPDNPIGIDWAGPTTLAADTPDQQWRWLAGILDGSTLWRG